ncbi:hypothetical protein Fmac_029145 [Flemingia macrophylla]|uniref:H15 domain-containing protein n=1 Tax=Flemingia macrophylla TaxID=520843 RepID=A0ABD1L9K9_9FABA
MKLKSSIYSPLTDDRCNDLNLNSQSCIVWKSSADLEIGNGNKKSHEFGRFPVFALPISLGGNSNVNNPIHSTFEIPPNPTQPTLPMTTERQPPQTPNPNPNPTTVKDSRTMHDRIMANLASKLKDPSVAAAADSSLFRHLRTPTHPPYALMIRAAISGLNEEGGSTESAISYFIKREFDDLPLAHRSVLGRHLGLLCEVSELARAEGGRYVLTDEVKNEIVVWEKEIETANGKEEDQVVKSDGRGRKCKGKPSKKREKVKLEEGVEGSSSGSNGGDGDKILEEEEKKLVSVKAKPQLGFRAGNVSQSNIGESESKSHAGSPRCSEARDDLWLLKVCAFQVRKSFMDEPGEPTSPTFHIDEGIQPLKHASAFLETQLEHLRIRCHGTLKTFQKLKIFVHEVLVALPGHTLVQ